MHFDGKGDMTFTALVMIFSVVSLIFTGTQAPKENLSKNYWLWMVVLLAFWMSVSYSVHGADSGFIRALISSLVYILFFNYARFNLKYLSSIFVFSSISFAYYILYYNSGVERGLWEVNAIPLAYNIACLLLISLSCMLLAPLLQTKAILILPTLCLAFVLIGTGSRGPAISFLLSFLLAVFSTRSLRITFKGLALTLLTLVALMISAYYFTDFIFRFTAISKELSNIAQGHLNSSIGYRVQMWSLGLDMLADMPWYGYGKDGLLTSLAAMKESGVVSENLFMIVIDHFHNGFLDILLRYGYLGLALFLCVVFYPIKQCKQCDSSCLLFIVIGLCSLQCLVNLSEYNNIHPQSVIYFIVPIGIILTMAKKKNEDRLLP
ncbi:O-antigen ligase family protein [Vibrio mexicanus]|uniref:O-antigen ligase family protein n=1 Tax=Vibrio mexicanus TaxID=1004326 RepID=UPI00138E5459|nr:O-antigen ligase family protein [Vibrio mexicanus]